MIGEEEALDHVSLAHVLQLHARRLGLGRESDEQTLAYEHLAHVQQAVAALHNCLLDRQIATYVLRFAHLVVHYLKIKPIDVSINNNSTFPLSLSGSIV